MPQINQVSNLLQGGGQTQIPPDIRARLLAAQLAQETAEAPKAPYTSRTAGLVNALTAGAGGFMQGQASSDLMDRQKAHQNLLADAIERFPSAGMQGASGAPASGTPSNGAAPTSGSFTSANPAGYDPKATEALIRARAPQFGIDPETAVKVARSEGLGSYTGDRGSSYGPYQFHYGNVASGGNAVGGLGDDFTKATGLDARDPSTVPQQIDFALQHAAQNGWGAWHGAANSGIGNMQGIGAAPTTAASADMPAPNARPVASATLPPGITADMVGAGQGGGPPQSDGSVRGDLLAAAAQHGMAVPDGDLPAPNAIPTGGAGLPPGVPSSSDAPPGAPEPSLRDTIQAAAAQHLTAPATGPSDPSDPKSNAFDYAMLPSGTRDQYAPSPEAGGLGGAPVALDPSMLSPSPDPGAGSMLPAAAPMPPDRPSMPGPAQSAPPAQAPSPPVSGLPAAGSGAALPQTGPLPPPGAQSLAAQQDPGAPAPNAVPAGPAPAGPAPMPAAPSPPMGLPGNSAMADPSSPQAFQRQQMLAQQLGGGGPPPSPSGFMAGIMGAGQRPGSSSGSIPPGAGLLGMNGPAMSAPPTGGPAGGGAAPPAAPGSNGPPPRYPAGSPQAAYDALLRDPMTSPEEMAMIQSRMNPQLPPEKLAQGEQLYGRRPDGSYGMVAQNGGKPIPLSAGQGLRDPNTGAPIGPTQATPDRYKAGADGSIVDSITGKSQADPNAFKIVEMDVGNGVKVPVRIGRNADGSPNVQVMVPGGGAAPPSVTAGAPPPTDRPAPIPGGVPSGGAPPPAPAAPQSPPPASPPPPTAAPAGPAAARSPLGPQVQALVDHAGAQQAQQAGAKAQAEANAKNDVDEIAASRTKLDQLRQSGQDIAQANAALDAYKGKMPTGPFGQNALWAQGVANSVGLGDPNQLSNLETFSKVATKVAASNIKEFTSKGTNLDLETELKNNPGLSVSDQTNRILMDHLGRTNVVQQQYEQAKQGYYDQNGSLKGFQPQWEQSISGANAIPLSRFPVMTKTTNGGTFQKYLSTDPSGYSWHPTGEVK